MVGPPQTQSASDRIELQRISSAKWQEFMDWIRPRAAERWAYRGQPRDFSLQPAIGRTDRYRAEDKFQLLNEFRRVAMNFVDRTSIITLWDWLALA